MKVNHFCAVFFSLSASLPGLFAFPEERFPAVFRLPLDFSQRSSSSGITQFIRFPSDTHAAPTFVTSFSSLPAVDYDPSDINNDNTWINYFPSVQSQFVQSTPISQSVYRPSGVHASPSSGVLDLSFSKSGASHFQGTPSFRTSASPLVTITPAANIRKRPILNTRIVSHHDSDEYHDDDDSMEHHGHSSVFIRVGDTETSYGVQHPSSGAKSLDEHIAFARPDEDFAFVKSDEDFAFARPDEDFAFARPDEHFAFARPDEDFVFVKSAAAQPTVSKVDHEDSEYGFKYDVTNGPDGHRSDSSTSNFGHTETKDGSTTRGRYYVDLPDGRRQIVEYYADETGYHPTITYV